MEHLEVLLEKNSPLLAWLRDYDKSSLDASIFARGYGASVLHDTSFSEDEMTCCIGLCEALVKRAALYTAAVIEWVALFYAAETDTKMEVLVYGDGSVLTKNPLHVAMINALYSDTTDAEYAIVQIPILKDYYAVEKDIGIAESMLDATLLATMRRAAGSIALHR